MQTNQLTANQPCYLLDAQRIAEKSAQRKASFVGDFKAAVSDVYSEARWEGDCWDDMGSVIEHRKYLAELNHGELALSQIYM